MKKLNKFGLLSVLLFVSILCHNDVIGQSVFGSSGIGELRYFGSARTVGFGGAGLAVIDQLAQSQLNPALWTSLERVSVGGGMLFEGIRFTQSSGTNNSKNGVINNLTFSAKLNSKIAIGGGLRSFADKDFNIEIKTDEFERSILGTGGLSTGYMGIAYNFWNKLSLGVSANYMSGVDDEFRTLDFTNDDFVDIDSDILRQKSGIGFLFGGVLSVNPRLRIGGVLFSESKLDITKRTIVFEDNPNDPKTEVVKAQDITIPVSFGVGFATDISSTLMFAGDVYHWRFSDLDVGEIDQNFQNSTRYSLGLEFGTINQSSGSFLGKTIYRIGGYYWDLYSLDIDGTSISEKFLTAGLGFLFNQNTARIDIGLEGGLRSSSSEAVGKETIVRAYITFVGSQIWFVR